MCLLTVDYSWGYTMPCKKHYSYTWTKGYGNDRLNAGDRSYWENLDAELQEYAAEIGLDYVTNDDSMSRPFFAPPVIVNYFYHSEIKKSARKGGENNA